MVSAFSEDLEADQSLAPRTPRMTSRSLFHDPLERDLGKKSTLAHFVTPLLRLAGLRRTGAYMDKNLIFGCATEKRASC